MKEVVAIDKLAQARTLLSPVRVQLLEHLEEPRSCRELSDLVGQTQQRINHHLKEMLKARLIRIVSRKKKRNLIEATYQRVGKAYWFSPQLARPGAMSPRAFRDKLSLHKLLVVAESLADDAARLLQATDAGSVPSLGFDAEIVLRSEDERQAFARDVLRAMHGVFERYQGVGGDGERYKVLLAAYPTPDSQMPRVRNDNDPREE